MTAAIGAGIAVFTGIGAGLGIGLATGKAVSNSKTAGGKQQDYNKPSFRMRTCRSNRYLWFRYRIIINRNVITGDNVTKGRW